MAFTTWDPKSKYRISESCNCGCSTPSECTCAHGHEETSCCDETANGGCGCPPAGLVAVKNGDGTFAGFLSPNDAQGFYLYVSTPPDGFVKLMKTAVFYGYVTPADWAIMYPLLP